MSPAAGREPDDERASRGPEDAVAAGDGAREHRHARLAVPRHRVVAGDGALDERLAVAGDVDVPAEARQVAWLARRREALHVAALRIDAPERPVPEVADPHAITRAS